MMQRNGKRLVLFPLPLQGHINPMLQLANILHSKGFSITIIHTNFNSPDPSKYPHFTFHFLQENLTETESSTTDVLDLLSLLNIKCIAPFRNCLSSLLSDVSQEAVACLISDAIFHFTQAVANSLKLPRIVLRTGGASSFVVFAAFPFLREKGYLPIQESKLEEPVKEFPPLKVKDIPVINTCHQEDLYQLVVNMVNETRASSGLIMNTYEDLEQLALASLREEFHIPIFPIGPFHKCSLPSSSSLLVQDESCISWLDKQTPKSVIYVSFGSIAAINDTELSEIAWGLANSKQPFLWVLRIGLVRGKEWLEPLPFGFLEEVKDRGQIIKWAPQLEVLAHQAIGAFWTHNSWNSTLESICEGVPMISMPCFTDQKVNARYVSDVWRIGLHLENGIDRGKVERIIKRLMAEKGGEEIRNRIECLKEKAKLSLCQGGSSCQSLDSLVAHIFSFESVIFQSQ
ncbi:UDP-glycosyltransferase 76F1 [Ricinus communis]|uniref:UDP-glucuronosyltransferase, putative n=1 Tax=Ricinus communis TaxID=3988 RepID=B9SWM9_RICCO|nr:UDP-glycosyltransferase 76F1 [Ricinus communis]EEF31968.1 UDP-glucuronosyltransferase, putative [Ricinus communis]|eukprot:XP_002530398.1 UDP-glycosyltransferase 76F1 [Ricinus communis]